MTPNDINRMLLRGDPGADIAEEISSLAQLHELAAGEAGVAVGDLKGLLADAIDAMTPRQRREWFSRASVQNTLRTAASE